MRFITTLLALALAILVVLFAVSNRTPVTLEFWPLPYSVDLGLYAAILSGALVGFVVGALAMWWIGGRKRRDLRQTRRKVKDLEKSLAEATAKAESGSAAV